MQAIEHTGSAPAGVDDCDSYEELCRFIRTVSEGSPVTHFIIHARKCHLKGLVRPPCREPPHAPPPPLPTPPPP